MFEVTIEEKWKGWHAVAGQPVLYHWATQLDYHQPSQSSISSMRQVLQYRTSVRAEYRNMVWNINYFDFCFVLHDQINLNLKYIMHACADLCHWLPCNSSHCCVPVRMVCCQAVHLCVFVVVDWIFFFSQEVKSNAQELFIYKGMTSIKLATGAWHRVIGKIHRLYSKENTWYESTVEKCKSTVEKCEYQVWHAQILRYGYTGKN